MGVVLLKRLDDALADGDSIHAVIKGAAVNNDGSTKVGFTAPSVEGQANVVAMAQALAGIEAETITYIEAHGTGTALGDPIEIAALTQVFAANSDKVGFCAIGSVKTNIGHLDTAAGIAGLIKTVLALKHKMLPPSLHFDEPNPKIDFANSPFYVNTELSEWKRGMTPRRAGVSSFGIGGTNAHVVLEEAPDVETPQPSRSWQLMLLSAKSSPALETSTENLKEHLKDNPHLNLADVAFTLGVGRSAFNHRRIVIGQDLEDAVNTLDTLDGKRVFTHIQGSGDRPIVFMFPGQGAQYAEMALELYRTESAFREQVDVCSELLMPQLGLDLRDILYPKGKGIDTSPLEQTLFAQPALFVIEYALAKLLMGWGVHPQAMIGHSIGEYVAACLAEVFSLEDALALVAIRGRLMKDLPRGAMLAIPLPHEEIQPLLGEELDLAAINAPSLCVVSGSNQAIDNLEKVLSKDDLACRRLHTSHAFHSQMMDPILKPFTERVGKVNLKHPKIPYISNVTGTWIRETEATDQSYWASHIRRTVRFAPGVEELLKEPESILLEIGPGKSLSTFAKNHLDKAHGQVVLPSMRHPQEEGSDIAFLLNTLGRLWLAGVEVNWSEFYSKERRHRIPLPTYPFERGRYWLEPGQGASNYSPSPRKRQEISDWFYIPIWKQSVAPVPFEPGALADQKLCWLAFIDEGGLGLQIAERLTQEGQDVIRVQVGEEFSRMGEGVYTINPQARDDYESLLKELRAEDKIPNRVLHLWSVTRPDNRGSGVDLSERHQNLGFYSLLFLAQAIGEGDITDPLRVEVISSNMQEVTGEEVLCPEKATILGPCKVIPKEYPNITCRSIDIYLPETGDWGEGTDGSPLTDRLVSELIAPPSDIVLAYRGNYRWVQAFESVRLEGAVEETKRLREGGVYLITGGLGDIGLEIARYLAEAVKAKLILLGRSGIPKRAEWGGWLEAHGDPDSVSRKIRKVQALEELGAEVVILKADVAKLEEMGEVLKQVYSRFGQINGVIHAAGIAGGGLTQLKASETAAKVLSPKVRGALVLNALFKDANLDFLVLFSSLTSILGKIGQVDYCAANAFLDAFAYYKTAKHGRFTVSINWDAWREVGMAVNTELPPDLKEWQEEDLKSGISSKDGVDVFKRILQSRLPQVLVSTRDLEAVIQQNRSLITSTALEKLEKDRPSEPTHSRPLLGSVYVPPRNEFEQNVADIWQELFGIDQVGIHDNFFELGGHSLLAIQIISRLQKTFQVKLSVNEFFDAPTVAELTKNLEKTKQENQEDVEKFAQILKGVEQLSEDEVKRVLAQKDLK